MRLLGLSGDTCCRFRYQDRCQSIGSGVHELRFRDRAGIYRAIYFLAGAGSIWLLHAFQKKTQKTPPQNIEVAKERLRRIK